jgi:hypothetical protein
MMLLGWCVCAHSLVIPSVGKYPFWGKSMPSSRRSANYVCPIATDDFKDPKIESLQLQALNAERSRYAFEQMVLSRLLDTGAKCIDAYYMTTAGSAEFSRVFNKEFYTSFRKFCGEVQHGSGKTSNMPNINFSEKLKPGDRFQMDICVSFDEDIKLCDIFKDVAEKEEDVLAINGLQQAWNDIVISAGDNVYFEVCEDVEKLPSKMFQVERTLQLWDSCMPKDVPFPKAAGIIMDGDRDALVSRVKRIRSAVWNYAGMEPKLRRLPMFGIYSRYTNVYLEISKLDAKVDAGFVKTDAGFVEINAKVDAGFVETKAGFVETKAGFAETKAGFAKVDAGFAIMVVGFVGLYAVLLFK